MPRRGTAVRREGIRAASAEANRRILLVCSVLAAGCPSSSKSPPAADAGPALDAGLSDAGPGDGGPTDAGVPDAGPADAGVPTTTGQFTRLTEGPPLPPPDEVIREGNGLPDSFIDAQHDAAGNMWAVSPSHLYVRRAGLIAWESFNTSNGLFGEQILSVGGGIANTAWVGYHGEGDGDATDPPSWWYTGGTDKVVLSGANITVTHYALVSPPGTYPQYPDGRFKLRRTLRVYPTKTGRFAGDAWFGCNHGGAQVAADGEVLEHHHPLLCVWDPSINACATTHEGDVPAIGFYANGNVLFGGTYGLGSLKYSDEPGGDFWGDEPIHNFQIFANPIDSNGYGSQDVDGVGAASDGSVWAVSEHTGLAHLHIDGKTVDVFQEAQGLPSNDITDLAIDSNDNAWIATTNNGLVRLNLHTGVWQQANGLPSSTTQRVMFEKTNTLSYVTVIVSGAIGVYVIPTGP